MHGVGTGRFSEVVERLRKVLLVFVLNVALLGLWQSLKRGPSLDARELRRAASLETEQGSVSAGATAVKPVPTGHAVLPPPQPRSSALPELASAGHPSLQSLTRGLRPVGPAQSHFVLAAYAIPQNLYQGPADLVLARLSGFAIVANEPAVQESLREAIMNINERPVVWNTTTHHAQIISGALIVRLRQMENLHTLARRHGLTVLSTDESIKTVYYKMPDGFQVFAGLQRLRLDHDVEHVEIELLSGGMHPR